MSVYPEKIRKRFRSPANCGDARNANASGKSASFTCGTFVALTLRIDDTDRRIESVLFRTNGCGFMIGAADALSDSLRGRSTSELHGLRDADLWNVIRDELGGDFPCDRRHCAETVFEAIRDGLADFRRHCIEEFQGEEALVCTCFGVSEDTIESVIARHSVIDVDDIAEICRAGAGCGSCRMLIEEMIAAGSTESSL